MSKSVENRDHNLKLLCKILFDELGFVTYYEVRLRTKSYVQSLKTYDVSDIDAYACSFLSDMTFETLGAECKSGESGALEELYKFMGVIKYCGIRKAYFVKTKIHQNARQVASRQNVSCYSEAELRRLLLGLNVDVDKQIKVERARYSRLLKAIADQGRVNEKIVDYLTFDYWNKENWRNIHNILHLLKNPKSGELFPNSDTNHKLFCYYVLELLTLSVLRNIGDAMVVGFSDINQALRVSLYGGAEALSEKQKIYDMVNQTLGENRQFSPPWEEDFVNLSTRFTDHTRDSSLTLNLLRDLRENSFYEDKVQIRLAMVKTYSDLTRKFVQDLMQFVSTHSEVDIDVFTEFMEI